MPQVISASRPRVAAYHLTGVILGISFPLLYVFGIEPAENIPNWFKTIIAVAAICGLGMVMYSLVRIFRILTTPGDWKAVITDDRLDWQTAIPHDDFPLSIALADISELVQLDTHAISSDNDLMVSTEYEIHLRDGTIRTIEQDSAGIYPHRVFLALKDRGIIYRQWVHDKTKDPDKWTKTVKKKY